MKNRRVVSGRREGGRWTEQEEERKRRMKRRINSLSEASVLQNDEAVSVKREGEKEKDRENGGKETEVGGKERRRGRE